MTKFERSHSLQKFIYTPGRSYFKKEGGYLQAHRLSKLVCEG